MNHHIDGTVLELRWLAGLCRQRIIVQTKNVREKRRSWKERILSVLRRPGSRSGLWMSHLVAVEQRKPQLGLDLFHPKCRSPFGASSLKMKISFLSISMR